MRALLEVPEYRIQKRGDGTYMPQFAVVKLYTGPVWSDLTKASSKEEAEAVCDEHYTTFYLSRSVVSECAYTPKEIE